MKTGKSLIDLATEVQRQSAAKRDVLVDTASIGVIAPAEGTGPKFRLPDGTDVTINPHAHYQIAQHTGVPQKYYDRMMTEAPELWQQNVSHWFNTNNTRRMVRTLDGSTRAFLSDRYGRFDNDLLAEVALPIMLNRGLEVMSAEVTDRHLYIKAVDRSVQAFVGDPKRGDVLYMGVVLSNSEVGAGSVNVEEFIYRLVCTNGAIGQQLMRRVHLGATGQANPDGTFEFFRSDTVRLMERTVQSQVRDILTGALTDEHAKQVAAKLTDATQQVVEKPVKAMEVLSNTLGLQDGERESALDHLIKGGDFSRYGLMNAVTRTAEDSADYERATTLERLGMQVIELSPSQWRTVATAA